MCRGDARRDGACRDDARRDDTRRGDARRGDKPRDGAHVETTRVETPRVGAMREVTVHEGVMREKTMRVRTTRVDRDDSHRDNAHRDGACRDDARRDWNGMDTPPRMQQGHMAIKTQEHEDFKDTRSREHKGTWTHGLMGHSQTNTRTQGHKGTRTYGQPQAQTQTQTQQRERTRRQHSAGWMALRSTATSRNKQETDGSRHSTAPPNAQNPFAAWILESPSNSAAIKTKISSIEAKERKLWMFEEGQLISSLESRQHRPDQSPQNRLILLSPSGDFNGGAQLQIFFSTQDAGRFE